MICLLPHSLISELDSGAHWKTEKKKRHLADERWGGGGGGGAKYTTARKYNTL
jgi:hypothetical protein